MIKKFAAVIEIDTDVFNDLQDDMQAFAIKEQAELLKNEIIKKLTEELNPNEH